MDTANRIREIFNNNLDEVLTIKNGEPLEDVDINSITFIKIIVAIEDEFEITFDNDKLDIGHFGSIEDISNYIRSKKGEI